MNVYALAGAAFLSGVFLGVGLFIQTQSVLSTGKAGWSPLCKWVGIGGLLFGVYTRGGVSEVLLQVGTFACGAVVAALCLELARRRRLR